MVVREIQQFSEIRTKARAYFCYLFSKNLPNNLPDISIDAVTSRLRKVMGDLSDCEGVYVLNERGEQVSATYTKEGKIEKDIGALRTSRAYYYRAMKEKRCTLTDPYPSLITHELTVTASQPIFDENGHVQYVACIDIPLKAVITIAHPTASDSFFGRIGKFAYSVFSFALAMVSLLLFVKAIELFLSQGINVNAIKIKEVFEATILLTLSLAIFDLVKTIFEEEVMGSHRKASSGIHKTMIKFLGSIIIALSIEALMLVFKFAITDPLMIIHAIYILGGVAMLLLGLALYIKFTSKLED